MKRGYRSHVPANLVSVYDGRRAASVASFPPTYVWTYRADATLENRESVHRAAEEMLRYSNPLKVSRIVIPSGVTVQRI